MPPSDGDFAEPEDAAAWYAGQLARRGPDGHAVPRLRPAAARHGPGGARGLDLPGVPRRSTTSAPVVAVRDCPKPPPTRVSLGFAAINAAEEVWLLVAGAARPAVARALAAGRGARRGARPGARLRGLPRGRREPAPRRPAARTNLPRPPATAHGRHDRRPADGAGGPQPATATPAPGTEPGRPPAAPAGDSGARRGAAGTPLSALAGQAPRRWCSRVSASSSRASPSASLRRSRT